MKIWINSVKDRIEVAAILVKNGYKVNQVREKKTPTAKAYNYGLEIEETDEMIVSSTREE